MAGRIMRIAREKNLNIYYEYDAIDRLTAETWRKRSDHAQIYAFWYDYDAANNRTRMRREAAGVEAESAYYIYNTANEMTSRATWTASDGSSSTYYYYDANGALLKEWNPSSGDTTYYAYADNQLIKRITPPSGAPDTWYFAYDGRLNRYAIDKAGTLVYYNWDGLRNLEERDDAGNLIARYTQGRSSIPGIGTVVEVERSAGGGTYYQYPLMDHRGTVYAIADANEDTGLEYTLDAFGRTLSPTTGIDTTVPNELIYQTNWLTIQVGSKSYRLSKARLYDLELEAFVSRDPIGSIDGLNSYQAFKNNPIKRTDASGLLTEKQHKEFVAIIEKIDQYVKAGLISPCAAFAYLFGKLYDLNKYSFDSTLRDAISYMTDPKYTTEGSLKPLAEGDYIRIVHKEQPWSGSWRPPDWLSKHGGMGEPPQGSTTGYIQDAGDTDTTGRHDHFVANAVGYAIGGTIFDAYESTDDSSSTDVKVNKLGREFAQWVNTSKLNEVQSGYRSMIRGEDISKWIYDRLCCEAGLKILFKGALTDEIIMKVDKKYEVDKAEEVLKKVRERQLEYRKMQRELKERLYREGLLQNDPPRDGKDW